MREIKFRGKSLATGEWVYGSLVTYAASRNISPDIYTKDTSEYIAVDAKTVGQYTGLKDKNGVEIYEGDIVQFFRIDEYTHCHEPRHVARIYWANGGFQFTDKYTPNRTLASLWNPGESMEVISSIYGNPELLEAK